MQRAGRGGHGSAKNRIGTRGEDKVFSLFIYLWLRSCIHLQACLIVYSSNGYYIWQVVLVPLGTVIHLQSGEIPSKVEKQSVKDLDPWELPGKLDADHSETNQQSSIENEIIPDIKSVHGNLSAQTLTPVEASTSTQQTSELERGDEEEIQYNVAELTKQGEQIIIACGGDGGLGNVCCPSVSVKPKIVHRDGESHSELSEDSKPSLSVGKPGSEAVLILELKSIADVGLVGKPNAGKSTLLGALSRAKPAIGHYAFTTLRPNLGNLNFDDLSITVADIPGLIKGAHVNRGLGHAFLRHIERTKVLAYVVDLASGLDGRKGIPPWEQLKDLILELEYHQEGLSNRPSLVVANKIDETGAMKVFEELERRVQGVPMYPVCAVLEEGVPELKAGLKLLVNGENLQTLALDNINLD